LHWRPDAGQGFCHAQSEVATFRGALAKLGWTEGNNVRIELRWGSANADKVKTFAKELVDLRPDRSPHSPSAHQPAASGLAAAQTNNSATMTQIVMNLIRIF
jgi:hypothetical protein